MLDPKYFNIYINDLFYLFVNKNVWNIADDTTPTACDIEQPTLLHNLESDTPSAVIWFEANYMKLNQDKSHFLISGSSGNLWAKVGDQMIWETYQEKQLDITIDNELKFKSHLLGICKKASAQVTALARLVKIISLNKKRLLMKSFIESQFSYCPLAWMLKQNCSRKMNRKINYIHEGVKNGMR